MDTFRLIGLCLPGYYVWTEPNGNISATWNGPSIWTLMNVFQMINIPQSKIEIVTDLIKNENVTATVQRQTIGFGGADYWPLQASLGYDEYKYFDFSLNIDQLDYYILSKKAFDEDNQVFMTGMFDTKTDIMILVSVIIFWLYLTLIMKEGLSTSLLNTCSLISNKGFAKKMKNVSLPTKFVLMIALCSSFLITTFFSGQIVAQLLVKSKGLNIKTIDDLQNKPWVNVIARKNKYIYGYAIRALKKRDLSNAIIPGKTYLDIPAARQLLKDVMTGDFVYFADSYEKDAIQNFCSMNISATSADFYWSPAIHSLPLSMAFPKKKNPVVQKVFDNMGWMDSFAMTKFHLRQLRSGLFRATGQGLVKPGPSPIPCSGWPMDKRDQPIKESKTDQCDFRDVSKSSALSNDMVEFKKLKIVFYILIVGLGAACLAFAVEVVEKKK